MQHMLKSWRRPNHGVWMAAGFIVSAIALAAVLKFEAVAVSALGQRFGANPDFQINGHLAGPDAQHALNAAYLAHLANIAHSLPPAAHHHAAPKGPDEGAPSLAHPEFTLAPPKQATE